MLENFFSNGDLSIDHEAFIRFLKEKSLITDKTQEDKIIEFCAQKGDITIEGATIEPPERITHKSFSGSSINMSQGTTSSSKSTSIKVGKDCSIKLTGDASITQNN